MSTAKRRKQFPIYETLLHLYPKSFRNEYSEQMVQTLADMLAGSESKHERTAIWLRVAGELPLSIAHEITNNVGETTMHKLAKISNKQLRIGGFILLALLLVGMCTVGRKSVMAATATVLYRSGVQHTLDTQNSALGNPFELFGISTPRSSDSCTVSAASGISTQLMCVTTVQGYTKLGETDADRQRNTENAQTLEAALQKAGYKAGNNGVTVTSLVTGIYEGKDWSPDAFYQKVIGQYTCTYDIRIAYANPSPKAVDMYLDCTRTKDVLGTPSTAVFHSDKGIQL